MHCGTRSSEPNASRRAAECGRDGGSAGERSELSETATPAARARGAMGRARDRILARVTTAEHSFMVVVAVLIGCLGGLGAVLFRVMIRLVQETSWGTAPYSLDLVRALPWWWVVLVPALGGLVVGPLVHFFAREAKGHGMPEVMEAVTLRSGVIRPRLVVVKSVASAVTIGSGGSVGREGPIAQIGAALGSTVGQWLKVSGSRLRTLVGCGAAAGIAATFNAPVAGALFAVEIILGDFGVSQFSPIVISSVMATVVSRHFLGNNPAFDVPPHGLVSGWELIAYAVLGLAAAGMALAFIGMLYRFEDEMEKVPVPPWLLPALGGLVVGALGLAAPGVLGGGYEAIDLALSGQLAVSALVFLAFVKLVATSVTLGSGGSGGVFAPSLFLGAMTGGAVGALAHQWFPTVTATPGAYALVGMGAVVAGATHAPITAILIIFELTSDYSLILPLMTSCIIATLLTTGVNKESIYTKKLLRRGIDVRHGRELNVLKSLRVGDVMERDFLTVPDDEGLAPMLDRVAASPATQLYAVREDGSLHGAIAIGDLRDAVRHADVLSHLVVASDLVREDVPAVSPADNLDLVMRIFAGRDSDELPVVDPATLRLIGTVARRHLLDAYNRELMKRDVVASLSGNLSAARAAEVSLGDGYRMIEIDAPGAFVERALRELDVRARHGVQVLLIKRLAKAGSHERFEVVPGPETVVLRGDRLVLMGQADDLDRLKRW